MVPPLLLIARMNKAVAKKACFAAHLHRARHTPTGMTFSSNRHPGLSFCLSMIFSENRYTLFRIML
jgi:hypothetical protein